MDAQPADLREVKYREVTVSPEMYSPGKYTWEEAIWPKQKSFHQSRAKYRLQVGGFGCLAKGTIIADGVAVENWQGGFVGQRYAGPAFLKGVAALYRVTTRSGKQVAVTSEHRFLSPVGWSPLSALCAGSLIAVDDNGSAAFARGISEDSQARCSAEPHRCGELLHPFQAAYLGKSPQSHKTDVYSNALDSFDRLSIENSLGRDQYLSASLTGTRHELVAAAPPLPGRHNPASDKTPRFRSTPHRHTDSVGQFHPAEDDAIFCSDLYSVYDSLNVSVPPRSILLNEQEIFYGASRQSGGVICEDEVSRDALPQCADLSLPVPRDYRQSFWDEITEILYIGEGEFYDLTVPGFEHYCAQGIWHHNSGKSKPLMWEAIFHALEFPGSESIILRKTIPDLKRTVISKFLSDVPKELYQDYNQSDHIVYFWPDPVTKKQSKLYFAACERDEDVGKYLSTEWVYIGFEELGEFSFGIWDAMAGRNRCPIPGSRACMAGATNPMGIGWSWIKKLWVDGECVHKIKRNEFCEECEGPARIDVRRTVALLGIDPEKFNPNDYEYFHSTVDDNPIYIQDTEYVNRLEASPNRERIRWGKLDAVSGQYFDNWEQNRHCRPAKDFIFQNWQTFTIGYDYGFGHWATMLWLTKAILKPRFEGEKPRMVNVFTRELYMQEKTPKEQATAVIANTPHDKDGNILEQVEHIHLSWERFIRTQGDFTIADEIGDLLSMAGFPRPSRSSTDRVAGWTKMYSLFDVDELFVLETCPVLAEAIPLLVRDDKNIEDVKKPKGASLNDDIADGARYAIAGTLLDAEDVPKDILLQARLAKIEDPMARYAAAYQNYNKEQAAQRKSPKQVSVPTWASKLKN